MIVLRVSFFIFWELSNKFLLCIADFVVLSRVFEFGALYFLDLWYASSLDTNPLPSFISLFSAAAEIASRYGLSIEGAPDPIWAKAWFDASVIFFRGAVNMSDPSLESVLAGVSILQSKSPPLLFQ